MMGKHLRWQWADGPVDERAEYIELRHADAVATSYFPNGKDGDSGLDEGDLS